MLPASSAFLEDVEVFDSYIVAYFADAAGPRVNCMPAPLGSSSTAEAVLESRELRLPSKLGVVAPVRNAPFTSHRVSVSFSGPLVPQQICVFDMRTGRLVGLEEQPLVGSARGVLNGSVCERIAVPDVPGLAVTVLHRRGMRLDSSNPCLMIGYGAYGVPVDMDFEPAHVSWLRRGWVVARAHVRGGGELGTDWHTAGARSSKENSISDFIKCAEHLVAQVWGRPRAPWGNDARP